MVRAQLGRGLRAKARPFFVSEVRAQQLGGNSQKKFRKVAVSEGNGLSYHQPTYRNNVFLYCFRSEEAHLTDKNRLSLAVSHL